MELEQQLAVLISEAADNGIPPVIIEQAIAPIIKLFAQQLKHLEYYVLQNLESDWVLTTISNSQLQQEKQVIYAFVSVQDAATFQRKTNPDLIAVPISIVQLLFQLFSFEQVDSIIFLENSQNLNQASEVKRSYLVEAISQQLQQLNSPPNNLA
ncbi:hypothetical protein NIES4102_12650 [Chondrocystis sp. NIES-4102]|nr:hypothetical protein NIES4102_12650 [Chondrocystis sp. NIES-4102]